MDTKKNIIKEIPVSGPQHLVMPANVIVGGGPIPEMGEEIRVTIVATGIK